jgi:hypothetical protein
VYNEGALRPVAAGTYTTDGNGFFPGMAITIPEGWSTTETDDGELSLHPDDRSGDALLLWKDMAAVVTNNRTGTVGHPLPEVAQTASALISWLTTTSDFAILAKPKSATVGNGVKGDQLTLTTSATANFAWDDCPDNPHCVAIVTDPARWGDNFFAIGGKEVARIFVATLPYPAKHTFFVVLDAVNPADLATFATEAQPIIDSLGLPASFTDN